jgi:hypothetical protein
MSLAWMLLSCLQDAPTFAGGAADVVYRHCTSCHREGEVAPFPLVSYTDVRKRAQQVLEFVESRRMPPWKPEHGYGDFVGERRMADADRDLLVRWLKAGAPEGDPKAVPAPPMFPEGWQFGEPDLVVTMAEEASIPAEGRDVYRAFVVPLNLTEDKYVRAVQYRPSNRKVTHHALLFLDVIGESRRKDAADSAPGFKGTGLGLGVLSGGMLAGWAPGAVSQPFPDGFGKEIKKNADLVLQLHFNPTGKPEKERSQVGLWFAKEKPERWVSMIGLAQRKLDLPPGERRIEVRDSFTTPVDVDLVGVVPHAHYLGKEVKVWAKTPEGKEIGLVWIKDWDFDWQEQYRYAGLVSIPKGSEFHMVWIYDNSADNPANPSNPPKRVRWGEQTEDEMALTFLQVAPRNRLDLIRLIAAMAAKRR